MRFKMAFETEESSRIRWPNSPWRLLQVAWDEPELPNTEKEGNCYVDEDQKEELDITYIYVEEELYDFENRPPLNCIDLFLNTLCGDSNAYIHGVEGSDDEEYGYDIEANTIEINYFLMMKMDLVLNFAPMILLFSGRKMKPLRKEMYESLP
ncbi:hypothetical protein LXL04_004689 [Taraxacum kok-saghyz]